MSATTLSPKSLASPNAQLNRATASEETNCIGIIDAARNALSAYLAQPGEHSLRKRLLAELINASAAIAALPRKDFQDPAVVVALDLIRAVSESGVLSILSTESNDVGLDSRAQKHWPGLLSRMLVRLPWQAPATPAFAEVPDWLWGDYAAWIFAAPQSFQLTENADAFAKCVLEKMGELAQWVGRNVGSPTVRSALQSYLANFSFLPLAVSASSLKRHAELHSRILTAGKRFDASLAATTGSRLDRPLRVAFVASHPSAIPEYSRLLDSERFEISLYVFEGAAEANGGDGDTASFAILSLLRSGNLTRQFQALAPDLANQLSELQTANLDVVIFTEELTASDGRLHQLALHRLAPLHVCSGATISSGLPTMDLFVATTGEAANFELADQFTERLGIREGCHLTFGDLSASTETLAVARTDLGLPANAFVMMAVARSVEITAAIREAWAALLRSLPNAYLVIQLLRADVMPAGTLEAFAAGIDQACAADGIGSERVLILGGVVESLAQLQSAVAVSDVFLDVGAFAEPDLLNVPLSLHVPIVSVAGTSFRSRRGAGLLKSLDLDCLIARDELHRNSIVEDLANHPEKLTSIRTKLTHAVAGLPLCRDQLAAAESLGVLLEAAYDELHAQGPQNFRKGKPIAITNEATFSIADALQSAEDGLAARDFGAALKCAQQVLRVSPAHATARAMVGRANMGLAQFGRAVEYLLAAVQTSDNASIWFDLAVALYQNDQRQQAVQALETTLRLDGTRADAWAMLVEIAREVGANDIASEALTAFAQLAPSDPRVALLQSQAGAA